MAMGVWGQRWVESAADGPDWDAGVLMWDMRRRIDTAALPPGRTLLQFDYADAPAEMRRWWLLIEDAEVDLCQSDPGFEVDLFVESTVRAMGRVWIGRARPARRHCRRGDRAARRWIRQGVEFRGRRSAEIRFRETQRTAYDHHCQG
jgi:hypothetical protein